MSAEEKIETHWEKRAQDTSDRIRHEWERVSKENPGMTPEQAFMSGCEFMWFEEVVPDSTEAYIRRLKDVGQLMALLTNL